MKRILSLVLLAMLAGPAAWAQAPDMESFAPADNGQALVNPGMGWMLYYYTNVLDRYGAKLAPEDIVEDFPGMGVVFLRLPWAFLEPEKDNFNWEIIDTPAQRWLQSGRQVKTKLEDDILPDLSEKTQEAIRKRQRRHWERKHGTNE